MLEEGADTPVRPYGCDDGVEERRWAKGAKPGSKAGRRLESLPHIRTPAPPYGRG